MQRAFQVRPLQQTRQLILLAGGELTMVFAQLRLDVRQIQSLEDLLLSMARHQQFGIARLFLGAEQTILIQAQTALDGALTHHDVVLLAAREIRECKRILCIRHHAQIRLDAALQDDAGFRIPLRQHVDDATNR